MKIQNFKYFLKEGFSSFFKNGVMSLASVIIVAACLILFGTYLIFSINLNSFGEQIQSQFEIRANISLETNEERAKSIGNQIKQFPNVANINYISREQAFQLGEKYFENMPELFESYKEINQNPLSAYYTISMTDLTKSAELVSQLDSIPEIVKIITHNDTMNGIISTVNTISSISLWVMVFLAVISVLIISNTIKMAVFARRKDINIMKFVGATDGFIRTPFIIEGIIIGLVGAMMSAPIILVSYNYMVGVFPTFITQAITFQSVWSIFPVIAECFVAGGLLLGVIGSFISVHKHLKV